MQWQQRISRSMCYVTASSIYLHPIVHLCSPQNRNQRCRPLEIARDLLPTLSPLSANAMPTYAPEHLTRSAVHRSQCRSGKGIASPYTSQSLPEDGNASPALNITWRSAGTSVEYSSMRRNPGGTMGTRRSFVSGTLLYGRASRHARIHTLH